MFACKCINILIQAKNNDIQKVEPNLLQLLKSENNDDFFKKVRTYIIFFIYFINYSMIAFILFFCM